MRRSDYCGTARGNLLLGILTAALFVILVALGTRRANAATQSRDFKWEVGISAQVITTTGTPQFLNVPPAALHARFYVEDAPACWSFGPIAANAAGGGKWPEGYVGKEANDRLLLQRFQFVTCSGSSAARIHVYYSRDWRQGDAP